MTLAEVPIITVDGPSGSGKSSLCRLLARRHNWQYLDSGCMYRLVALQALLLQVSTTDIDALTILANRLDIEFIPKKSGDDYLVISAGVDKSAQLYTDAISMAASAIAQHRAVREALIKHQIRFCIPPGLIADGRDMGTVIFPNAQLKIYLTADFETRMHRRYQQLKSKAGTTDAGSIGVAIKQRDENDKNRQQSPLRPAQDAIFIDSTSLDIESSYLKITELAINAGLFC